MDEATADPLERYDQFQQALNAAEHSDPERALAYCREHYFEPLGIGSGRIAIAVDQQSVAKVAWRERGLLDNHIEAELWRQAEKQQDDLEELLCPVISLRESGVLLQARCLPTVGSALDPATQQMITRLAVHGITDGAVNLGFFDDPRSADTRIVCYDYALLRPETFARLFPTTTNNFGSLPF